MNFKRLMLVIGLMVILIVGMAAALLVLRGQLDDDNSVVEVYDAPQGNLRGSVFDPPLEIEDFSLSSTRGGDFRLSEQRGKVTLMYFGYMTCPDFCPTTMAVLQRVYRELGDQQQNVDVVMVTVDPERDSLERMVQYVAAFDPNFIGVRGEDDHLQSVLNQFGVVAVKREVDSALGYLIDHTASVFLIDPDGNLAERFVYETPYQDILHDVKAILDAQT